MCKHVDFIVPAGDEAIVTQIRGLCEANDMDYSIIYHGKVMFRGSEFTLLSSDDSVYTGPIEQYECMKRVYHSSLRLRYALMCSVYPLVSCIDKKIESIANPPFSINDLINRTIILFGSCPMFQKWVNYSLNRYGRRTDPLSVYPCMEQVISELRGE